MTMILTKAQVGAMYTFMGELEQENVQFAKKLSALEAAKKNIEENLASTTEKCNAAYEKIKSDKALYEQEVKNLTANIERNQKKIGELTSKIQGLNQEVTTQNGVKQALVQKVQELGAVLLQTQTKANKLAQEIEKSKSDIASLKEELETPNPVTHLNRALHAFEKRAETIGKGETTIEKGILNFMGCAAGIVAMVASGPFAPALSGIAALILGRNYAAATMSIAHENYKESKKVDRVMSLMKGLDFTVNHYKPSVTRTMINDGEYLTDDSERRTEWIDIYNLARREISKLAHKVQKNKLDHLLPANYFQEIESKCAEIKAKDAADPHASLRNRQPDRIIYQYADHSGGWD